MKDIQLIPLQKSHRPAYEALYESSFSASERKPLDYMLTGDRSAAFDVLTVSTPDHPVAGMVITVTHGALTMLDYLAVSPRAAGAGAGARPSAPYFQTNQGDPRRPSLFGDRNTAPSVHSPRSLRKRRATGTAQGLLPVCRHDGNGNPRLHLRQRYGTAGLPRGCKVHHLSGIRRPTESHLPCPHDGGIHITEKPTELVPVGFFIYLTVSFLRSGLPCKGSRSSLRSPSTARRNGSWSPPWYGDRHK